MTTNDGMDAAELTSVGQSIYWLKTIVHQGQRVLESRNVPVLHMNSALFNTPSKMEELFFLTACRKAQRWIDHLQLNSPESTTFSSLSTDVKDVRDNREHDEERYGVGKKRDELIRPARIESGPSISTGMSITAHSGGRYLLGGVVDVEEVMEAAEELMRQLIVKYNAYWDQKISYKPEVAESYHIEPRFRTK